LEAALDKPAKGPGGRPAHDRLKMFKALLVQRFYIDAHKYFDIRISKTAG
jgi:hypothetical protein